MPLYCQVEAEAKEPDADMTEQEMADALSIGDIANQAEHKQQAYESNKRLKKSLQAVSSDKGELFFVAKCQSMLHWTQQAYHAISCVMLALMSQARSCMP